ncbi:MAG: M4 family metallopeptidase, partial [Bacteroidota bacterium]
MSAAQALGLSNRPQDPGLALAKRYGQEFGLKDPGRELAPMEKKEKANGQKTVKYQQQHEGVPVMGGELIVNTNGEGDLYSINGEISLDLTLDTQPSISADQARRTAMESMARWYEKSPEDFVSTDPALWIFDESLLRPSTRPAELTWRMEVTAKDSGLPVRELVLVNAENGSISLHFNQVDQAESPSRDFVGSTMKAPLAVLGKTWYVATTGTDANDCSTSSTPCATINAAITKAASTGDTIKVAAGTYKGSIIIYGSDQVVWINKSILLSGGWNAGFTTQSGVSTVDGEGIRRGINVFDNNVSPTVTIERFTVQNGYDFLGGGGVGNSGTLTIDQSSIVGNKVGDICCTSGGGGAGISNSGTLLIKNTTISNNTIIGGYNGSAIYNGGTITINNSTISDNKGSEAIHNSPRGSITFNNSTISYNAGGIDNLNSITSSSIALGNTILAQNDQDCAGPATSLGHNLIGNGYGCTLSGAAGDLIGTSTSPVDPWLNPLRDNGGFTFTRALGSNSPAIDAGDPATCLTTDQRGIARPVGSKCDIGAYEGSMPWEPSPLVRTYSANNTSDLMHAFLCDQTDPNCGPGDAQAKAAHKFAIGTYNLYATKYGRDSVDNKGMRIISTLQYCTTDWRDPCPYDNAYWTGTQMVYGSKYPFALADDVVAHELTHGVTQYESNLFYYYQSGAINESFSDLWGEYYDQVGNPTAGDTAAVKWLIGEDVTGLGATRSMSNPPLFQDPDKMTSTYYYTGWLDGYGVHWNSGVNNKAAYLMVDGGSFNGRTVAALGWDKVGAIYYEANTNLLTSGADYSDLYYALQQACTNLVGQKGITAGDCTSVKNAVDAVEMNLQPATPYNPEAPLCNTPGTTPNVVFADDFENGLGNWTFNNGAYPRWQMDSDVRGPFVQSGSHALYSDDSPVAITDATAQLAPVAIPANAYLHFFQAWELDSDSYGNNYDGGVLEYSINGGSSWVDAGPLMDYNGYNGTLSNQYGNPLGGRSAFVDSSHGYISTRLNLSSLAGQTVRFRWRLGLDGTAHGLGWWVDNLKIVQCKEIPAGWVGGVSISSNRNVVAVARPHVGAEVASYDGFSSGSLSAYVPMLFKNAYGTYNSALYVQNVHGSNTATITVKYYDSDGSLKCTDNDTVAPLSSKGYWVPAVVCDSGSLPAGWVGGAVITSDQPIVAVGRPHIGSEVMTYNGFTGGSLTSYIPMLFKGAYGGSYNSAFYIQN